MPQSRDRKEFYHKLIHTPMDKLHEFIESLTPEERIYHKAAIEWRRDYPTMTPYLFDIEGEFSKKVMESAAWMDSGGYLHAVPKERDKK